MAMVYFLEILGVLLFVFGTIGFLVATIIMAIKRNKKVRYTAIMIPISLVLGFIVLVISGILYGQTDEYKEQMVQKEVEEQKITQTIKELENAELESESTTTEKINAELTEAEDIKETIQPTESELENTTETNLQANQIFALDLLENWDNHIGDYVTVSFEISSVMEHSDGIEIYSPYYDGITSNIRAMLKDGANVRQGDWITVTGTVGDRPYEGLKDAVINDVGDKPKELFMTAKTEYDEQKRIEAQSYEDAFKENAESPTYDDLMRYPDTYKEKQIKVEVKIVRIEPDGWIFDGDIEGAMSGEKVAIYDGREKKEPKLREGDSVTIYGYGKGTTTVKIQDVSGWIPKTVDEYDIPAIDIRYIEF